MKNRITKEQVIINGQGDTIYRTIYQDSRGYFIYWRYHPWSVIWLVNCWTLSEERKAITLS